MSHSQQYEGGEGGEEGRRGRGKGGGEEEIMTLFQWSTLFSQVPSFKNNIHIPMTLNCFTYETFKSGT